MATKVESSLTTRSGLALHAVQHPTQNTPKAVLVFNHGYGEHVSRYDGVFGKMAEQGVEVRGFDMRAFGRSEPNPANRGKVEKFSDLVDDLEDFAKHVQASAPAEVPLFLAGSSLGALVATHCLLRNAVPFRGLLLFSPAIDVEWNPVLRVQAALGGVLARVVPHSRIVAAVRPEDMSPDPAVQKDYIEDPLNYVGNVRARTASEILNGMKQLKKLAPALAVPVYGQHGDKDVCTSVPAHRRFHDVIASKDKTLNIVPGGYHELLMGPEKEACTQAIVDWILQRSGPQDVLNASKI